MDDDASHTIYILLLAIVIEGDQKAPLSIDATPRCRGGRYSFPWIAPLYPWYVPYIAECYNVCACVEVYNHTAPESIFLMHCIFEFINCLVLSTSLINFCNNQSPRIFFEIEVWRARWEIKKSYFFLNQVLLCYLFTVESSIILLKNPSFSTETTTFFCER